MSKILTFSFCDSFIEKLAGYIEKEYVKAGKDISRLALVFGGKRPALFVKRELARRLKENYYPPRFFAIDELMHYIVGRNEVFEPANDLDHGYLMYQLAREYAPSILKGRETFAQFLPWAQELATFIDQLDLEGIDDQALGSLKQSAQIGFDVPEEINRLLQQIAVLRRMYHEYMKKAKQYSRGFIYRRAAELIPQTAFSSFDHIIFCNFFYFHQCEERVVQSLMKQDKATLIFQGDERKWPVLDHVAKQFQCEIKEGKNIDEPHFDLHLHAGFDVHSQVGLVREILQTIKEPQETVVVLPKADHIVPLLSELSSVVEEFNISMGYPLKRSSLYSLFEFLFQAQLSRKDKKYYARDYLRVMRHPFIKNLRLLDNPTAMRILIHKIEEVLTGQIVSPISGCLFIELEDIETCEELFLATLEMFGHVNIETDRRSLARAIETLHQILFSNWEEIATFALLAKQVEKFCNVLVKKSFLSHYPLNINITERIYDMCDELAKVSFKEEVFPQEDIFRIFDSKLSKEMVSFSGSPLKGLQILGLLETRSLNFKNVIMMDVNEKNLPALNVVEPLIPREVMIMLNLNRVELEEDIQRYQFMRLIAPAKKVHLVYQENKEKEKSRFIEELIWEEEKKKGKLNVVKEERVLFTMDVKPMRKVIKKTPQMASFLKDFTFSASGLNTYLKDPVEFYYNYVLGLKEKEDLLDEPEARKVGTFVHELLEHSFKPFLNKKPQINKFFREKFFQEFEDRFANHFGRSMSAKGARLPSVGQGSASGGNSDAALLKTVLTERLNRFLDKEEQDEERQVEKILFLEERFTNTIPLSCGPVKFQYIVDRVDRMPDGSIMVIDYKTGSIDPMPKKLESQKKMDFSREKIYKTVNSFQMPLYFRLFEEKFPDTSLNAALYNLRTLELKAFGKGKREQTQELNKVYLEALDFIVSEILNPEIDFVASEESVF